MRDLKAAYDAGVMARIRTGAPCPYPSMSTERTAWLCGWTEGDLVTLLGFIRPRADGTFPAVLRLIGRDGDPPAQDSEGVAP